MALPLPSRLCATYLTLWGGGTRITAVPLTYNQIYLFHAVPSGNGGISFGYTNSVTAAEIDTVQKRGQRVVLTFGGANAGFNFQTRAQSQNFVDGFKRIYDQLGGVDGLDFNNFEARIGSNVTEMTWIAQQLKAAYGSNFSISAPPAPDAGWAPQDRVLCKAMLASGAMDYAGPQFYDSEGYKNGNTIIAYMEEWIRDVAGGDASKMVVGYSANYGAGPTLATCQSSWKTLVAKYPKLRGVFTWSAQDDASGGWNWSKAMQPLVGNQLITDTGTPPAPNPPAPPPAPNPPAPAPSTGGVVDWKFGERYPLNTVVKFTNGKFYQVYQVDATGTSNATDPTVSTWYWKETTAPSAPPTSSPPPAPAPLKAGDKVKHKTGLTGKVTKVTSAAITVAFDLKAADLTKV